MTKPETNAIELESGNYGCPQCKSDQLKLITHMDGKDFFKNVYNCCGCGFPISFTHQRSKEDQMYWE